MRYIISISGGAGSTLATHKAIERVGIDNVVLLFADTNTEDESLYELINVMENRLKKVVWLDNDGQDIWDIFNKHGIIRTPTGACKASLELKQKPLAKWVNNNCDPKDTIIVSGLDWTENDRIKRFNSRWKPYKCWHPMRQYKMALCDMKSEIKRLGYPIQALYEKEYPHNNCGGGCVLAGLAQWAGLKKDYPEKFYYHKKREQEFNKLHKNKFTILRDQRSVDGKRAVRPITLGEFELRLKKNNINLRDFRTGCGCMLGEQLTLDELL